MTTVDDQTSLPLSTGSAVTRVGGVLARYGLVVVIGWIGLLKFTSYEANGIEPLVANSPFMSWVYDVFSVSTFSTCSAYSRWRRRYCSRSNRGGPGCLRWAA